MPSRHHASMIGPSAKAQGLLVLLASTLATPAGAEVVLDGRTGPARALAGPEFAIGAELGRTEGKNLFHSFARFGLTAGQRATFSGPDGIANVVGRVTGGERSEVDGVLRVTIPGADLWLFNPAGIAFGPNASLDLQGSLHVSTADEVRFADGARFSARDPARSTFTTAAPEAFGFLGRDPAAVTVDRSTLAVPAGEAFSIVAGDITIDGGKDGTASGGNQGLIRAEAGTISLIAMGGPGVARPGTAAVDGDGLADIRLLDQAHVDTSGDGGGSIRVRADGLQLRDRSWLSADNTGPTDAAGGVNVSADRVGVRNGSQIRADVAGSGRGGTVVVDAGEIRLLRAGEIRSKVGGPGSGRLVQASADDILIAGGNSERVSGIGSEVDPGAGGDAADVRVTADRIRLTNSGTITSSTRGDGDAGRVEIDVGSLEIERGGNVRSNTFAGGDAGAVIIRNARLVSVVGTGTNDLTGITSQAATGSSGDAGTIRIMADYIDITSGGAQIITSTFADGNAGRITIESDQITISGDTVEAFAGVLSSAETGSGGQGGRIRIQADVLTLAGTFSGIRSTTEGAGDAGSIRLFVDELRVRGAGPSGWEPGISTATYAGGKGGEIAIHASQITNNFGFIGSNTFGPGNAGTVTIDADVVHFENEGRIFNGTSGGGDGGAVVVNADVLIADAMVDHENRFHTGIASTAEANSSGKSGDVSVTAESILLINGGKITTATTGSGAGGSIEISADTIVVDNALVSASTTSESDLATGGSIKIEAGSIALMNEGQVFSGTFGAAAAGEIAVRAGTVLIQAPTDRQPTFLTGLASTAEAGSQGHAGTVRLDAESLTVRDGGTVSSASRGEGRAGSIVLRVAGRLLLDNSTIQTTSAAAGGGEIRLEVGDAIVLRDSEVSTSVAGGEDPAAGNISIDPRVLAIDNSVIKADAPAGFGGNIRIEADNILVPRGDLAALLARGDISASGETEDVDGTVAIGASEVDLSGGLVVLEGAFVDVSALLRERCAARQDVGASSFTGAGRGGLPPSPDGMLASGLSAGAAAGADAAGAQGFWPAGMADGCAP